MVGGLRARTAWLSHTGPHGGRGATPDREAMGLFIDNARTAKIVDNVKLPANAKKAISAYAKLRKKADETTVALRQPLVAQFGSYAADVLSNGT